MITDFILCRPPITTSGGSRRERQTLLDEYALSVFWRNHFDLVPTSSLCLVWETHSRRHLKLALLSGQTTDTYQGIRCKKHRAVTCSERLLFKFECVSFDSELKTRCTLKKPGTNSLDHNCATYNLVKNIEIMQQT